MQVAARLSGFTESVIREMTRVSDAHGAINLAQGFPDFDPPDALVEAGVRALRSGFHQYSLTWGSQRFRQGLAAKQSRFSGLEIDADAHITVTCGSTEAMMVALMTVCNPGDKVGVFSPYYENYEADAILSGARPVYIHLEPPDYAFDPEALRKTMSQIRALVLCNPSNPTGRVFSREELLVIAELAQELDVFVLTDEVYEHIVYPPHEHTYLSALPGMFERTLTCSSLSKTYAITGWRLGYVIASPGITEGARKVHDFLTLGAPAPLQEAAATALAFPDTYYEELRSDYLRRRDIFLSYLERTGLSFSRPEGAYYVLVDVSPLRVEDDTAFCIWMAKEIGVAAVPGSSFFREPVNHLIRLNFAKREKTLHEAGERLLRLREKA